MAFRKVLPLAHMHGREFISVSAEGEAATVAIFRAGGELYAIEDRCSHANWPLTQGTYRDGIVECALHKAQFCVRTGAALRLPGRRPVRVFPLKVEDDHIYIDFGSQQ